MIVFRHLFVFISCAIWPCHSNAQVLEAPSDQNGATLLEELVNSLEVKSSIKYGDLLAENVTVYEDGVLVSQSKDDWLKKFKVKLETEGMIYDVSVGFASANRILLIEYFNSSLTWGGSTPSHCCWRYDAVAYDIQGNKISKISRLTGGSKKVEFPGLKPDGS